MLSESHEDSSVEIPPRAATTNTTSHAAIGVIAQTVPHTRLLSADPTPHARPTTAPMMIATAILPYESVYGRNYGRTSTLMASRESIRR